MYPQELPENRKSPQTFPLTAVSPFLTITVKTMTFSEAYAEARRQLCALWSGWCSATDAQIRTHICYDDCTVFVGNDPIRLAICDTYECPVPTIPPLGVSLGVSATIVPPGAIITFTATPVGGMPPYIYAWGFGDGSTSHTLVPTVDHSYQAVGSYQVQVAVIDSQPVVAGATIRLTISEEAPPVGGGNAALWGLLGLAGLVGVVALGKKGDKREQARKLRQQASALRQQAAQLRASGKHQQAQAVEQRATELENKASQLEAEATREEQEKARREAEKYQRAR